MGNENQSENKNAPAYKPLTKMQIDMLAIKAKNFLELELNKKQNQLANKEKELCSLINYNNRSKQTEQQKIISLFQDYNTIHACQYLIKYCQVVQEKSLQIEQSNGSAQKIMDLLPYINGLAYSSKYFNIQALNDFTTAMSGFFRVDIAMQVQNDIRIDEDLKNYLKVVTTQTYEMNLYVIEFSKKYNIPIDTINLSGLNYQVNPVPPQQQQLPYQYQQQPLQYQQQQQLYNQQQQIQIAQQQYYQPQIYPNGQQPQYAQQLPQFQQQPYQQQYPLDNKSYNPAQTQPYQQRQSLGQNIDITGNQQFQQLPQQPQQSPQQLKIQKLDSNEAYNILQNNQLFFQQEFQNNQLLIQQQQSPVVPTQQNNSSKIDSNFNNNNQPLDQFQNQSPQNYGNNNQLNQEPYAQKDQNGNFQFQRGNSFDNSEDQQKQIPQPKYPGLQKNMDQNEYHQQVLNKIGQNIENQNTEKLEEEQALKNQQDIATNMEQLRLQYAAMKKNQNQN